MKNDFLETFKNSKNIAIVGLSSSPEKDSYKVAKYLQAHQYKIIPINPNASEILGEKVYRSLNEIRENIEIVNIFRPSEECLDITKQAIKLIIKPKIIWMQLGIQNGDAKKLAEDNGIQVVMNRCIKIEHSRFLSETDF